MSLKQQPTVPDVADKWFAPARVPWIIQRSQPVRWMFAPPGVVLVRSKKKVRPLSLPIRPLDQPPPQTNGPRENVVARALPSPKTEGGRNQRKKKLLTWLDWTLSLSGCPFPISHLTFQAADLSDEPSSAIAADVAAVVAAAVGDLTNISLPFPDAQQMKKTDKLMESIGWKYISDEETTAAYFFFFSLDFYFSFSPSLLWLLQQAGKGGLYLADPRVSPSFFFLLNPSQSIKSFHIAFSWEREKKENRK